MTISRAHRPAFLSGYAAARAGRSYFTCPHAEGSVERDDWCAGFNGFVAWTR